MMTRVKDQADGKIYSLTVFLNCKFNLQQNLKEKKIPIYIKLYFSDITKDLENQTPPQNQTDVIINCYKHLLLFAATGRQHNPPLFKVPLPSLSSSAATFFCRHHLRLPLPSSSSSVDASFAATICRCHLPQRHLHHCPCPLQLTHLCCPPPQPTSSSSASAATSLSSSATATASLLSAAAVITVLFLKCRHHHHPHPLPITHQLHQLK
jgi:hypothetical protein